MLVSFVTTGWDEVLTSYSAFPVAALALELATALHLAIGTSAGSPSLRWCVCVGCGEIILSECFMGAE